MNNNMLTKPLFIIVLILSVVTYFGCEKKTSETEEPQDKDSVTSAAGQAAGNKTEPVESQIIIPDITGRWSGMFDKRSTVLEITGQTDSSFSGKISISYREAIHQEVKGSFSPTTMDMSMTDQLHSRYQGKYNGKLSDDHKNFSGTFIMSLDNSKFSFNLNKQ